MGYSNEISKSTSYWQHAERSVVLKYKFKIGSVSAGLFYIAIISKSSSASEFHLRFLLVAFVDMI